MRDGQPASEPVSVSHVIAGYYALSFVPQASGRYDMSATLLPNFDGSDEGGFEARPFWVLQTGVALPWTGFGRRLTNAPTLRGWMPRTSGVEDPLLERLIDAASTMIERETGRLFIATQVSEVHDGSYANGSYRDLLTVKYAPVIWNPADRPVIIETGQTLTVALLAADEPDVLLYRDKGVFRRRAGTGAAPIYGLLYAPPNRQWTPGYANVRISYRAGWEGEDMPADIVQACCELAWLLFKEGRTTGVEDVAADGKATRLTKRLSGPAQQTIASYRAYRGSTAKDWAVGP